MGQYFRPCLLAKNYKETYDPVIDSVDCYKLGNGAKLMEHSYVGNVFVAGAIRMLRDNKDNPFVWCGDYADPVNEKMHNGRNMYDFACMGDFDTEQTKLNCSDLMEISKREHISDEEWCEFINENFDKYVINHTKKQYCKVPAFDKDKWTYHPLPLLAFDGEMGSYYGSDEDMVGIWAYDVLESSNEIPEGYEELDVFFYERYRALNGNNVVVEPRKGSGFVANLVDKDTKKKITSAVAPDRQTAIRKLYRMLYNEYKY